MYLQELRGEVSQGDVFDNLPLAFVRQELRRPAALDVRGMLITYDCKYDKPATRFVLIAGVYLLAGVPADRWGNIRKNKVFSTLHLEASSLFEESFVDFRYIGLVEKALIVEEAQERGRIISLDDEAQLALQEQLSAFFGYGRGR